MLPDRVSNPGPLTYESDALPIALRGPAIAVVKTASNQASADKYNGVHGGRYRLRSGATASSVPPESTQPTE